MRNLLLVTYQFPPIGGSGVQRALKLARYLPKAGWRAHVLTAGHTHYPLLDPSLAADHAGEIVVHRACGLEPAGVARSICRHLAMDGTIPWWLSALEDRLYWRMGRICNRLPIPEEEVLWVPAAVRQARRLVERYDIQAIVTTSPPHSAHLVGMNLKRRLGLPWIADLRDPILDNFAYRPGGGLTDRFWHWLERSIVHHTDHIVVTCPELADRLAARFSGVDRRRFSTITNGYDPEDAPGPPPAVTDTPPSGRRFVLAYVGAFYREQTIEPVLRAVRALRTARLDFGRAIEFRLIGSLSTEQRRLLQPGDSAFFNDLGYCSHDEALRELAGADVLLLMTPANEGGRLCIPAKTFEYLAFGGHVLGCVHEGTMLHRLLLEAGNTTFVDCRKPESLAPAVERCYDAWKAGALTSPRRMENLERYRRDRLAADFAKIVESFTQTTTGKPVRTRSAGSARRPAKPGRDWAGSNRGVTRRPLAPAPQEAGV